MAIAVQDYAIASYIYIIANSYSFQRPDASRTDANVVSNLDVCCLGSIDTSTHVSTQRIETFAAGEFEIVAYFYIRCQVFVKIKSVLYL